MKAEEIKPGKLLDEASTAQPGSSMRCNQEWYDLARVLMARKLTWGQAIEWLRERGVHQYIPIVEAPEVDWSLFSPWVKWIAMDEDLRWREHVSEPRSEGSFWYSPGNRVIPNEYFPKNYTGPWQSSKVKRPEGV